MLALVFSEAVLVIEPSVNNRVDRFERVDGEIDLDVTEEAKDHVIKLGYDVDYGARPLRRVIQSMIEDPLAEALLKSGLK